VLTAIALTPSAPVLVPELAGAAATEVAGFRAAALAAAATLPDRWIAVGVGPADAVIEPDVRGTFAGYGADVGVALSPAAGPDPHAPDPQALPLCALFAGWLRGQVNPQARVQVRVYAADHSPDTAIACGRALRAEIDTAAEPIGVLVIADGANTLTQSAPGGYDPGAGDSQARLDDALAAGDSDALTRLPDCVIGRVAYQVLAGLVPAPVSRKNGATEILRGAPYGVGYFVGTWNPRPQ
jgi:hypothetical protein